MMLVNGDPADRLSCADRGLQYGDGVFETVLVRAGEPCLWSRHMQRLEYGCQRLKIAYKVDSAQLRQRLDVLIRQHDDAQAVVVAKVMVTRGEGGRGYRPMPASEPTEIISLHAFQMPAPQIYKEGVSVRTLQTRLSENPLLAGIKHLNRLEQVLASQELADAEYEGVLLDQHDRLIEATRSNILMKIGGRWITPDVSMSGVAGTLRSEILECGPEWGVKVAISSVTQAELPGIESMLLCNSVAGLVPVNLIDKHRLDVSSAIKEIQSKVSRYLPFPSA